MTSITVNYSSRRRKNFRRRDSTQWVVSGNVMLSQNKSSVNEAVIPRPMTNLARQTPREESDLMQNDGCSYKPIYRQLSMRETNSHEEEANACSGTISPKPQDSSTCQPGDETSELAERLRNRRHNLGICSEASSICESSSSGDTENNGETSIEGEGTADVHIDNTDCSSGSVSSQSGSDEIDWAFSPRTRNPRDSSGLERTTNKLRQHPRIISLLHYFVSTANSESNSSITGGYVNKSSFVASYSRVFKASTPGVDAKLAEKMAGAEWSHMTNRFSKTIPASKFMNRMFEIINNSTQSFDVEEYVGFASLLFDRMAKHHDHMGGEKRFKWRSLSDIDAVNDDEHLSTDVDPNLIPYPHPNVYAAPKQIYGDSQRLLKIEQFRMMAESSELGRNIERLKEDSTRFRRLKTEQQPLQNKEKGFMKNTICKLRQRRRQSSETKSSGSSKGRGRASPTRAKSPTKSAAQSKEKSTNNRTAPAKKKNESKNPPSKHRSKTRSVKKEIVAARTAKHIVAQATRSLVEAEQAAIAGSDAADSSDKNEQSGTSGDLMFEGHDPMNWLARTTSTVNIGKEDGNNNKCDNELVDATQFTFSFSNNERDAYIIPGIRSAPASFSEPDLEHDFSADAAPVETPLSPELGDGARQVLVGADSGGEVADDGENWEDVQSVAGINAEKPLEGSMELNIDTDALLRIYESQETHADEASVFERVESTLLGRTSSLDMPPHFRSTNTESLSKSRSTTKSKEKKAKEKDKDKSKKSRTRKSKNKPKRNSKKSSSQRSKKPPSSSSGGVEIESAYDAMNSNSSNNNSNKANLKMSVEGAPASMVPMHEMSPMYEADMNSDDSVAFIEDEGDEKRDHGVNEAEKKSGSNKTKTSAKHKRSKKKRKSKMNKKSASSASKKRSNRTAPNGRVPTDYLRDVAAAARQHYHRESIEDECEDSDLQEHNGGDGRQVRFAGNFSQESVSVDTIDATTTN